MAKKKSPENEPEYSIEEGFEKLEELIGRLEDPEVELEPSFELYEQGVKLLRELNGRIDRVEGKVLSLREDGSLTDLDGGDDDT